MNYTQKEFLDIIKTYNNMNRRKNGIKNKKVMQDTKYSSYKVNSWFALSSPNIPTFEDALMLAVKYNFDIKELIKE